MAFNLEKELISKYKNTGQCKTNIADGGPGGARLFGELNPMYGRPWWDDSTPTEKIEEWKRKTARIGEDNAMFGVSPKERMSEDTYIIWRQKQHIRKIGESNPNYGNRKLSKYYKQHPDISKQKQGRPGIKNGRCIPVRLLDKDKNIIKEFNYIQLCAEYLKGILDTKTKIDCIAIEIGKHIKSGTSYKGFFFE